MGKLRIWIGVAISVLFIYLAFRKVDWDSLKNALARANYFYLIPIVAITFLTYGIRAWRWKYMLIRIKAISLYSLFVATVIGFMANNILPARMGEFVRAYALGRKEGLGTSLSLATVVVERIFDVFSLLLCALLILPMLSPQKLLLYLLLLVNVLSLAVVILLKLKTPTLLRLIRSAMFRFPPKWADRVVGALDSFSSGLRILESWKDVLIALVLSIALWGTVAATIYLAILSFGIDVPPVAPMVVMVVLMLGLMVPSSPGFVGTFQYFASWGLLTFGVPESKALSFSIVYHASQHLPITALGLFYLWRGGLSFREISGKVKRL